MKKQHLQLNQFFSIAILIIAYFTYFNNYEIPAKLIWDEHYYIADAHRYLAGIAFMEMHPPLGKQIVALGEWLFQSNASIDTTTFLDLEQIKTLPEHYSFKGMRFFPTLLGTLSALLFFWILYYISYRPLLSFLFSSLYLFDNALIVQSRAAMLDAPQIFFALSCLLFFIYRLGKTNNGFHYLLLGLLIGLCSAVRYNGLILLLLFPFWSLYHCNTFTLHWKQLRNISYHFLLTLAGIILVLSLSFYIHFLLAKTVTANPYSISPTYQKIVESGKQSDLESFWPMLNETFLFTQNYAAKVPDYQDCDLKEKGSPISGWPFMNKSIRYLADRSVDSSTDNKTHYVYLQGNPIIWYSALMAIVVSISFLLSYILFAAKIKNKRYLILIAALSLMYCSYFFVLFNLQRVWYLYHYLLPLCFALLLFFILFNALYEHSLQSARPVLYWAVLIFCAEIVYCYWFFSPISYYHPVALEVFHQRQWLDFWHLKPLP